MAEQLDESDPLFHRFLLCVGRDMDHATATAVGFRPTKAIHVHIFTGDRANYFRSGNKDSAGRAKDNDVGQRWAVSRSTCCRPKNNGNLGNFATCPGHRKKNPPHTIKTGDPFTQSCTTGVPYANDGGRVGEGAVIGGNDCPATNGPHRSTLNSGVGAESNAVNSTRGAYGREHTAVVNRRDCGEFTTIKKISEAHQW